MLSIQQYLERIHAHTMTKETRDGKEYLKHISSLSPFKACFWSAPSVRNEAFFATWDNKRESFKTTHSYLLSISKTAYLKGLPPEAIIAMMFYWLCVHTNERPTLANAYKPLYGYIGRLERNADAKAIREELKTKERNQTRERVKRYRAKKKEKTNVVYLKPNTKAPANRRSVPLQSQALGEARVL